MCCYKPVFITGACLGHKLFSPCSSNLLKRTDFSIGLRGEERFLGDFNIERLKYQEKFISINNDVLRKKGFLLFMVGKYQVCNECSEK